MLLMVVIFLVMKRFFSCVMLGGVVKVGIVNIVFIILVVVDGILKFLRKV